MPEELIDDDNDTFMIGLGTRVRIRPTVYLVLEASPRVGGFEPDVAHVSFGIEKRAGGQPVSAQLLERLWHDARSDRAGRASNDDWYLGFNISRKFF